MELLLFPIRLIFAFLLAAGAWYMTSLILWAGPTSFYSAAVISAFVMTWLFSTVSRFTASCMDVTLNQKLHWNAVIIPAMLFLALSLTTAFLYDNAQQQWAKSKAELVKTFGPRGYEILEDNIVKVLENDHQMIIMEGARLGLPPKYNYIAFWYMAVLLFPVVGILFAYYKTKAANREYDLIKFLSEAAQQPG